MYVSVPKEIDRLQAKVSNIHNFKVYRKVAENQITYFSWTIIASRDGSGLLAYG